jgi:hypothetical protein
MIVTGRSGVGPTCRRWPLSGARTVAGRVTGGSISGYGCVVCKRLTTDIEIAGVIPSAMGAP